LRFLQEGSKCRDRARVLADKVLGDSLLATDGSVVGVHASSNTRPRQFTRTESILSTRRSRSCQISFDMPRTLTLTCLALILCHCMREVRADSKPAPDEWTAYARDAMGTKFSPAAQINRETVGQLHPVWTYRTGDFALGEKRARDETTPLYADGVLYASTPFGGVRALDAETGRELWAFDSELRLDGDYGDFTNRGVASWVDPGSPADAPCHRRIYVAPVDARLIALDARTGAPCADFGQGGQIQLDRDLLNAPEFEGEYAVTSPPAVVGGRLVVGSAVADNQRAQAPSGVVRAFDARTGARSWAWDPVPRDPATPGYDTWKGKIAHQTGAANAWAPISADESRDLVFIPVGSASPDFYGGERLGQNLFANSVVALRASTGQLVWHFQVVHHDLWDYDVASQPALFTFHRDGRDIPALLQPTKMGHLFILNRETGEPLFPVEERPVPASDVPGEEAWPTQPFPTLPAPLGPQRLKPEDAFGVNDAGRAQCREQMEHLRSEGIFTPPSLRGSVLFPGNVGGANWSGAAVDPERHVAFIPSNRVATHLALIPRAEYRDVRRSRNRLDSVAPQAGTAFAMQRQMLMGPGAVPCNPPPWGVMTAVDLDSGQKRWEVPFGRMGHLASVPGSAEWGSINLGGVLATAGGMVFAGGALDQSIHGLDSDSGRELWTAKLPAGVHAAPMTFRSPSGRQLLVVAAGGHKDLRDKVGDYIVAYSLEGPASPEPAVAAGRYRGHLVLDASRRPVDIELTLEGASARLSLSTPDHIEGKGSGTASEQGLSADVAWTYAPKSCSGTLHLSAQIANRGTALIGELEYVDGCDGGKKKQGTLAVWRGDRASSSLAKAEAPGQGTSTTFPN
jgi:quinoprotein glucose dehydrogenase